MEFDRLPPEGPLLDRWIVARRGPRNPLDPRRAYAAFVEPERAPDGAMVDVATILLTNRECPYKCLMCDLWVNTLEQSVPVGAIPAQIRTALLELPPARWIKLYNAGSFFDARAIPPADHDEVIALLEPFERVIVECHPSLVGPACMAFHERLGFRLEVAMGLETIHPDVLPRLNKRMTAADFHAAACRLAAAGIPSRSFILLRPPFLSEGEGVEWALRSAAFAFDAGVECVVVIPTRAGNGALDELARAGQFTSPALKSLETVLDRGLDSLKAPRRLFADTWEIEQLDACSVCVTRRTSRIRHMNRHQERPAVIECPHCDIAGNGTKS